MNKFLQGLRRIGKWEWVMIFIAAVVIGAVLNHLWPLYGGPVRGVVTDGNASQPLADVTVIVKWKGSLSGVHGSRYVCYHVALAQTDEQGRFYVPWWWQQTIVGNGPAWLSSVWMVTMDRSIEVAAYKRGYFLNPEPYPFSRGEEVHIMMQRSKEMSTVQLGRLLKLERDILCEADRLTKLPLLEAVYDEARSSAQTIQETRWVDNMLVEIETLQYGENEAEKRAAHREAALPKGGRK